MKTLEDITALTPWIPAWHETGACMDRRHVLWLYEILKRTGVRRTLEIGVHSGCSSSAFVAAGVPDSHFCDITRRADAMSVISGHGTFHQRKGCDVIRDSEPFDLVFVDGRHDMEAVMEEWEALKAKPPKIIIAHDVNSTSIGFPHCEGAAWLADQAYAAGYKHEVDAWQRQGEMTHRGLYVGTIAPEFGQIVSDTADYIY